MFFILAYINITKHSTNCFINNIDTVESLDEKQSIYVICYILVSYMKPLMIQ